MPHIQNLRGVSNNPPPGPKCYTGRYCHSPVVRCQNPTAMADQDVGNPSIIKIKFICILLAFMPKNRKSGLICIVLLPYPGLVPMICNAHCTTEILLGYDM